MYLTHDTYRLNPLKNLVRYYVHDGLIVREERMIIILLPRALALDVCRKKLDSISFWHFSIVTSLTFKLLLLVLLLALVKAIKMIFVDFIFFWAHSDCPCIKNIIQHLTFYFIFGGARHPVKNLTYPGQFYHFRRFPLAADISKCLLLSQAATCIFYILTML